MEGLAAVASGFAVGSITIQLAEHVKKLHDFWSSVQDAPKEVRDMVRDLNLLKRVLEDILHSEQEHGPDGVTSDILSSCTGKLDSLMAIVKQFEPGLASKSWKSRKWSGIKILIRSETIKNFRRTLEELKTTLILARQTSAERAHRTRQAAHEESVNTILNHLNNLQLSATVTTTTISRQISDIDDHLADLRTKIRQMIPPDTSPLLRSGFESWMTRCLKESVIDTEGKEDTCDSGMRNSSKEHSPDLPTSDPKPSRMQLWERLLTDERYSVTESIFGKLVFQSKSYRILPRVSGSSLTAPFEDQYEFETKFVLHPAWWLAKCGFRAGVEAIISRSIRGWKNHLKSFRAVPDDSLVFDFCRTGNIDGVRCLFERNQASPWDTDSDGYTPLHFAAIQHDSDLCELLLRSGADPRAASYETSHSWPRTPLYLAAGSDASGGENLESVQNCFRLLLKDVDFSDPTTGIWSTLDRLSEIFVMCNPTRVGVYMAAEILPWILRLFRDDVRLNLCELSVGYLLGMVSGGTLISESTEVLALILSVTDMVDARIGCGQFCLSHGQSYNGFSMMHKFLLTDSSTMKLFVSKGADLHLVGMRDEYSGQPETPLSLAMYSSIGFFVLRDILEDFGFNSSSLDKFVGEELKRSPLVAAGWAQDTLCALFSYKFQPANSTLALCGAERCKRCHEGEGIVQPLWMQKLEKLKTREEYIDGFGRAKTSDQEDTREAKEGPEGNHDRHDRHGGNEAGSDENCDGHKFGPTRGLHMSKDDGEQSPQIESEDDNDNNNNEELNHNIDSYDTVEANYWLCWYCYMAEAEGEQKSSEDEETQTPQDEDEQGSDYEDSPFLLSI